VDGWTLEEETWRQLKEKVGVCNWSRAILEDDYVLQVPTRGGVYIICASAKDILPGSVMDRLYNAIYAGQATNLRQRFGQHLRGYRKVQKAKLIFQRLHFWYTEFQNEKLDDVEQALLDTFGPPANDKNVIKAKVGEPISAGKMQGV
jgi:hypothetical protein